MKKQIKMWIRLNKPYVIWVSILLVYTLIMLGIIIIFSDDGKENFTDRLKQAEEVTEIVTEEYQGNED